MADWKPPCGRRTKQIATVMKTLRRAEDLAPSIRNPEIYRQIYVAEQDFDEGKCKAGRRMLQTAAKSARWLLKQAQKAAEYRRSYKG